MKYTWVKGHPRRLPGRSKKKKDSISSRIILFACFGVLIFFALYYVLYLISRIPVQVFYEFFGAIFVIVAVFIAFMVYRFLRKFRQTSQGHIQQPAQVQYQSVQPMAYYGVQEQRPQSTKPPTRIDNLDSILNLTPKEFEEFVGRLLSAIGYLDVQVIGRSGDLGVDVSAKDPEGNKVVVQCKRFGRSKAVTGPDIVSFLGTITIHDNAKGIYVTTSRFTAPARDVARQHSIRLIDGNLLLQWIQNARRTS